MRVGLLLVVGSWLFGLCTGWQPRGGSAVEGVAGVGSRYAGVLAQLDRGGDRACPVVCVRPRSRGPAPAPVFTLALGGAVLGGCARFGAGVGRWAGSVCDRVLFASQGGTGVGLGGRLWPA